MQKLELDRIAKKFNIPLITRETPSDDDVSKVVGQRIITTLEARFRKLSGLEKERIQRFKLVAQTILQQENLDDGKAQDVIDDTQYNLFSMLLDSCYQESLNQGYNIVGKQDVHAEKNNNKPKRNRKRRPKNTTGGDKNHDRA